MRLATLTTLLCGTSGEILQWQSVSTDLKDNGFTRYLLKGATAEISIADLTPPEDSIIFFGCSPNSNVDWSVQVGAYLTSWEFLNQEKMDWSYTPTPHKSESRWPTYFYRSYHDVIGFSDEHNLYMNSWDHGDCRNNDGHMCPLNQLGYTRMSLFLNSQNGLFRCGANTRSNTPSMKDTYSVVAYYKPHKVQGDCDNFGSCSASCDGGSQSCTKDCPSNPWNFSCQNGIKTQSCNNHKCDFPCPSETCWSYDASAQSCTLIPKKCVSLECESTQMKMKMAPGVFGTTPDQITESIKNMTLTSAKVTINEVEYPDGYEKVCQLDGDCDLTYDIKNETLSFEFQLTSSNNPELLKLDDTTTVQISPSTGSDISFQCDYSTKIDVSSGNYTVEDVSIKGTEISTGKLDAGFEMNLGSEKINLGSDQTVIITWAIKTLTNIKFFLESCHVVQDEVEIDIIKNACLSSIFIKDDSFKASTTEIEFAYRTFKITGKTSNRQKMRCHITICKSDYNDIPTSDQQCDSDSPYKYTAKQTLAESTVSSAASSY